MRRLLRSARLFVQGLRIFYSCASPWWMLVLATPTILVLCAAVALLNLGYDEEPGGEP